MLRGGFNLRRPAVCWQAIRSGGWTSRNAKARSERAFAERFEGGSKRLSNMAHPAGFEPTTPAFGGRLRFFKYHLVIFKISHLQSG